MIQLSPTGRLLGEGTSFDAFVTHRRVEDDRRVFLAIETKLTEPFSDARDLQLHLSAAWTNSG